MKKILSTVLAFTLTATSLSCAAVAFSASAADYVYKIGDVTAYAGEGLGLPDESITSDTELGDYYDSDDISKSLLVLPITATGIHDTAATRAAIKLTDEEKTVFTQFSTTDNSVLCSYADPTGQYEEVSVFDGGRWDYSKDKNYFCLTAPDGNNVTATEGVACYIYFMVADDATVNSAAVSMGLKAETDADGTYYTFPIEWVGEDAEQNIHTDTSSTESQLVEGIQYETGSIKVYLDASAVTEPETTTAVTTEAKTTTTVTKAETTAPKTTTPKTTTTVATETESHLGDVNADGKVSSEDATLVLKDFANSMVGIKSTVDLSRGDCDGNGKISSEDATIILKAFAQSMIDNKTITHIER